MTTTCDEFERQMTAAGWRLENGCWCKTVTQSEIDLQAMATITNVVNDSPFRGAPLHTLRSLGTNWTRVNDRQFTVTYRILASPDMDGAGFDQCPDGRRIAFYKELDFQKALPA